LAARCAARAKPAPIAHGVARGRVVSADGTTRPRPRDDAHDGSVLLLGGVGADTTGSCPRDDASDESAIEADGACGAGTTGFCPRSEAATRHCREQSQRHDRR
jgi:hypothetical protein